jgi:hypothetical protein
LRRPEGLVKKSINKHFPVDILDFANITGIKFSQFLDQTSTINGSNLIKDNPGLFTAETQL